MERDSGNFKVICLECWKHISDFHEFQQTVLQSQKKFFGDTEDEGLCEDNTHFAIKMETECEVLVPQHNHVDRGGNSEYVYGYIVKEEVDFINAPEAEHLEIGNNSIFLTDEQELNSLANSSLDGKTSFVKSSTNTAGNSKNLESNTQLNDNKTDNTSFLGYARTNIQVTENKHKDNLTSSNTMTKTNDEEELMDISESELNALDAYDGLDENDDLYLPSRTSRSMTRKIKAQKSKTTNNLKRKLQSTATKANDSQRINHQPKILKVEKLPDISVEPTKKLSPAKRPIKSKREEELDDVIAQWRPNLDCRICRHETYTTFTLLQQHFRELHSKEEFYVQCCDIKIKKRGHLAEHIRLHMDNKAFKCAYCNQRCNRKRNLRLHMLNKHGITDSDVIPVKDEPPPETNTSVDALDDSKFISQWLPNLECVVCKDMCPSFSVLLEHFGEKHPKEECYILCCGYKLNQQHLIAQHLRERTHPRAFKCELCNGCFTMKRALDYHMRQEHAESCISTNQISLDDDTEEMTDKNEEKDSDYYFINKLGSKESDDLIAQWLPTLECGLCKDSFATFTLLKKHFTQIHPNDSGYVLCCQRKFVKRYRLQEHARTHLFSKALKCELCGKRYSRRESLQNHMTKQHCGYISKDDEVKNTPCDESFSMNNNASKTDPLTSSTSKRKSIKELDDIIAQWRPDLECVVCQETYSTFTLLQDHFRKQHPGVECYISCCRSKFAGRYDIVEHSRYHNDPNAFKCEFCGRCFARKRALNGHFQRHRMS